MKLTEKFLKSKNKNTEGKKHKDYPDGSGLLVRVFETGAQTFYFRFRWEGKQAIAKIGSYPEISLKDARGIHQQMRTSMEQGIDPRKRIMSQKGITLEQGYQYWYDGHIKTNRKQPRRVERNFQKYILKDYGKLIIDEMTIPEWEKVVKQSNAPVLGGYLLRECKAMCSYLMRKQRITNDIIRHIVINDVGKMPEKRDRVYTRTELKKVYDYCVDERNPIEYRLPLFIVMITGCRIGEVATAMRKDFDFTNMEWTVNKGNSKAKVQIKRPIPEFMVPLFNDLFEAQGSTKYLLLNTRGGQIRPAWLSTKLNTLRAGIGIEGMILHSFRHTLTTHYADLKIPPHIAEKQCGHVMAGVQAIYNRGTYLEEQREAMEKYLTWIIEED